MLCRSSPSEPCSTASDTPASSATSLTLITGSNRNALSELGTVEWAYNPSILEAGAEELPWVWGQPRLWQDPISKKQKQKNNNKKHTTRKGDLPWLSCIAIHKAVYYIHSRKKSRQMCRHLWTQKLFNLRKTFVNHFLYDSLHIYL